MIKLLDVPGENVLAAVSITEMHQQDWAALVSALEQNIRQFGKVRWC